MVERNLIDVLFLARNDSSNRGYTFAQSLKKIGMEARVLAKNLNPHGYPRQAERWKDWKLKKYLNEAKVVVWMHSWQEDLPYSLKGKRQIVFHGGSYYRNQYKRINEIFNPIVDMTLIHTRDLWGLGAKNEVWLLPPVDTEGIRPRFLHPSKKAVIGHFPSNYKKKGSIIIDKVMGKFAHEKWFKERFEYVFDPSVLMWRNHMDRVSRCAIYIEQLRSDILEWGVQALEAAALGNILVTSFVSKDVYEREYGECPIQVSNSEKELGEMMEKLLSLNNDELLELQKRMRRWVERCHSYKVIGKRFKKILEGIV